MIGVVCGMQREARFLRHPGIRVAIAGSRRELALARLSELIGSGVNALVSFGTAGALRPGIATGALILGIEAVDAHGVRWAANQRLVNSLAVRLPGVVQGTVLGIDSPVLAPSGKADWSRQTGALAVDMESHLVAAEAARRGLSFAILRAIVDDSETEIPAALANSIDEQGRVRALAIVGALVSRSVRVRDLLDLRRRFDKAADGLLRGGAALSGLGD